MNNDTCETWLTGLLITCPAGSRADNCPCVAFEDLPIVEKVIVSIEMKDDDRVRILEHHSQCMQKRAECPDRL